jgi:hypothetical protein
MWMNDQNTKPMNPLSYIRPAETTCRVPTITTRRGPWPSIPAP